MKTYVADIYFDHVPDHAALVRATSDAFDVPASEVIAGWFIGDEVRAAYDNPLIRIVWLQNHDHEGQFPYMYGLAIENADPAGSKTYAQCLATITRRLGIAAVMPTMYGKMRLLGPDGSDRLVVRDDDIIRLTAQDRATLDHAYRTAQPVAS